MRKWRWAYIAGLKKYAAGGGDPSHVASVASFFISRIDSMVDAIVKARLKTISDPKEQALLRSLLGKVAIANAKLTYQRYKEIFAGPEWNELAKKGAQTQRVLWASTSTKDPSYPDVLYIEELIGPDTVNTIPPQTLEAFRDHGKPKASLEADLDAAHDTMDTLEKVGISMKKVTDDLVTQAVKLFAEPFDKLLNTVDAKCKFASASRGGCANLHPAGPRSINNSPRPSKIGKWPVRCGASGRAMPRCGPAPTRAVGWGGWGSRKTSLRTGSI